jgi:hypothetical protein
MQKTRRKVRNFIGEECVGGDGRETEPVYDPATGEVIAETPLSTKEDVDRAVKAADAAFKDWAATPVIQRIQVPFATRCCWRTFRRIAGPGHSGERQGRQGRGQGGEAGPYREFMERFGYSLRQETLIFIEVMRASARTRAHPPRRWRP